MPAVLTNIDDVTPPGSKIILLMGKTRAGKSTFINDFLCRPEMKAGASLGSITGEMSYATGTINYRDIDQPIALVDTVGWAGSDPTLTKGVILKDVVKRLSSSQTEPTVAGIIYLHRITDVSMGLEQVDNLEIFEALVGTKAMGNVLFVTNGWCRPDDEDSFERLEDLETQLKEKYWKKAISAGARIERLDDKDSRVSDKRLTSAHKAAYCRNAERIIRLILDYPPSQEIGIQRECREAGPDFTLGNLAPGQALKNQLERDAKNAEMDGLDATINRADLHMLNNTKIHDLTNPSGRELFVHETALAVFGDSEMGRNMATVSNVCTKAGLWVAKTWGGRGDYIADEFPEMVRATAEGARRGGELAEIIGFADNDTEEVSRLILGIGGAVVGGIVKGTQIFAKHASGSTNNTLGLPF